MTVRNDLFMNVAKDAVYHQRQHIQNLQVAKTVMPMSCQVFKALKRYCALLIRPAVAAALQDELQALVLQIDQYLDNLQSEFEYRAQVQACLSLLPASCLPCCLPAMLSACHVACLPSCLPCCLPAILPACHTACLPSHQQVSHL